MKNIPSTRISASYEQARQEQLALCDILEEIADSLPYNIDERACINAAQMIIPLIKRSHKMEVEILFPLLEDSDNCLANLSATIKRIRSEHIRDEFSAEEIAEILLSYGKGKPNQSPEATGYILRGFFESQRRHIAFVHELIAPKINNIQAY